MASNMLARAEFVLAAHRWGDLPPDRGREVAFAGRSNAGKSSALNALTGRKALARTSRTPGRTQQMVVFSLTEDLRIVDLPGYGYAQVPAALRQHWRHEVDAYLQQRQSLRGVVLIADIRHPLKESDQQMLAFCHARQLGCHVLLTKADKLSRSAAQTALATLQRQVVDSDWSATAQIFSAPTRAGVDVARTRVCAWLEAGNGPVA